jgi:5-methylcytosine-specific restriction endonuclease McrA
VNCAICSELFTYSKFRKHGGGKLCCSERCRDSRIKRLTNETQAHRYRADPAYRDRIISANQSRRARALGLGSETILLTYLIERDHARCGICRKMVRAKAGPRRPSIDHIIPLSRGGENALANVQLAHLDCNIAKRNRGHGEQLLLIG